MRLELGKVTLGQVYQVCTDGSQTFFQYPNLKQAVFSLMKEGLTKPVVLNSDFLQKYEPSNACAALWDRINRWFLALWHEICLCFSRRYSEKFKSSASLIDSKCAAETSKLIKLQTASQEPQAIVKGNSEAFLAESHSPDHTEVNQEEQKAAVSSVMAKCKKIFLGKLAAHQKFKHDLQQRLDYLIEKEAEVDFEIQGLQLEWSQKNSELSNINPENDSGAILQSIEPTKLKLLQRQRLLEAITEYQGKYFFSKWVADTSFIKQEYPEFDSSKPADALSKVKLEIHSLQKSVSNATSKAEACQQASAETNLYLKNLQNTILEKSKEKSALQDNQKAIKRMQEQIKVWEEKVFAPLPEKEIQEFNAKFVIGKTKDVLQPCPEGPTPSDQIDSGALEDQKDVAASNLLEEEEAAYPVYDSFIKECSEKVCDELQLVLTTFFEKCEAKPCLDSWKQKKNVYQMNLKKPLMLWTEKNGYANGAIFILESKPTFKLLDSKIEFLSDFYIYYKYGPALFRTSISEICYDANSGQIKFSKKGYFKMNDNDSLSDLVHALKEGEMVYGNYEMFYKQKMAAKLE